MDTSNLEEGELVIVVARLEGSQGADVEVPTGSLLVLVLLTSLEPIVPSIVCDGARWDGTNSPLGTSLGLEIFNVTTNAYRTVVGVRNTGDFVLVLGGNQSDEAAGRKGEGNAGTHDNRLCLGQLQCGTKTWNLKQKKEIEAFIANRGRAAARQHYLYKAGLGWETAHSHRDDMTVITARHRRLTACQSQCHDYYFGRRNTRLVNRSIGWLHRLHLPSRRRATSQWMPVSGWLSPQKWLRLLEVPDLE